MELGEIESGIPVDPRTRTPFPFHKMKVGDSFSVKYSPEEKILMARMRTNAFMYGKRNNMKFKTRTVGELEIRVWRVE